MHTKWKLCAASTLLALSLSACGTGNNAAGGNNSNNPGGTGGQGTTANSVQPYAMHPANLNNSYDSMMLTRDSSVQISQQIADQIAAMDEVKSANVLLTKNNAFIAVVLPPGTATNATGGINAKNPTDHIHQAAAGADVSLQLKQRIAEKVKAVQPNIRNVYISANPDFVQRLNSFSQEVQNGRPVAGFMNEFNTLVQRIFPSNAGSRLPTGPSK